MVTAAVPLPSPVAVEVRNGSFLHDDAGSIPGWRFSASRVEYDDSDWSARVLRDEKVDAALALDASGAGFVLDSRHAEARADLSSDGLPLKPFTRYRVNLSYEYLDGMPLGLVGLHPVGGILNLDLAFLPAHDRSEGARQVSLELHTGRSEGPYRLEVSLTGIGRLGVSELSLAELGPYQTPDSTVLVVDLLSLQPDPANLELWSSVTKLRDLYGFERIEIAHPLELTTSTLREVDPALIVFSPTAVAIDANPPGFIKRWRHERGIRKALEYATDMDLPVLGICAGHQSVASSHGAFLARIRDDDTGEYLHELGPTEVTIAADDPLFEGLPRSGVFRIIEAHLVLVHDEFQGAASLASTPEFPTQVFRYAPAAGNRHAWYTFQGHPEKDWEHACPEGSVLIGNLMRIWGFAG